MTVSVGDWVRFQRGGLLVTGVVEYVKPRSSWERSDRAVTDVGEVHVDQILEVRPRPKETP